MQKQYFDATSYLSRAHATQSDSAVISSDDTSSIVDYDNSVKDSQQKPPFGLSQCQVFFIATLVGMLLTGIALAAVITLYLENTKSTSTATSSFTTTKITTTSTATTETTTTATTSTSTTTTTTVTTATVSLSASGPILNLDPNILSSAGWIECFNSTYALVLNKNAVADVLARCNKSKLLLACRPMTAPNYTLAAMGLRTDVLFNCSNNNTCTHVANGVGWYFSDTYSWGFVSGTDAVSRSSCDTASINPIYRLCWHTGSSGGFRCGSTTSLNSATTWQRSVWHAD